jgi:hypothetical protein
MLGLITILGGAAFGADGEVTKDDTQKTIEELRAENETLKEKLNSVVLRVGEENSATSEVIHQGEQGDEWQISARTYIENELYDGYDGWNPSENILMLGTGINMVKGKWGYHINIEQRLTGHVNSDGADNQLIRSDWKVRYQATDKIGVAFKYRAERGNQKRASWAAESNRDRDRVEIGIDTSYKYLSGWFVVGHDVDSGQSSGGEIIGKGKGWYYEGDMGPTFQIMDKFAIRPTIYSTGEFYHGYGTEDNTMYDHQIRLMAIYQATDKLTIMPRIRYSIYRGVENTSDKYTHSMIGEGHLYTSDFRVRAELLAAYTINDKWSIDGGIAYDWQDRTGGSGSDWDSETRTLDMFWYTLGVNYRF